MPFSTDCPMHLRSWRGVAPAETTKSQVLELLGEPLSEFHFSEPEMTNLEYGPTRNGLGDVVSLTPDGTVQYLDVWAIPENNEPTLTAGDVAAEMGRAPTIAYLNGTGDRFGPDVVYAWPDCGYAIVAYPQGLYASSPGDTPEYRTSPTNPAVGTRAYGLTIAAFTEADLVFRQTIFTPMSNEEFAASMALKRIGYIGSDWWLDPQ